MDQLPPSYFVHGTLSVALENKNNVRYITLSTITKTLLITTYNAALDI